ncbi:MAG: hypothetical protein ACYTF1_22865 [Planctomycetota bacterium]|jgi:hypothetical protein
MSESNAWINTLTDLGHFIRHNSKCHYWSPSQLTKGEYYPFYSDNLPKDTVEVYHITPVNLPNLIQLARKVIQLMQKAGLRSPFPTSDAPSDPRHETYNVLQELLAAARQEQAIIQKQQY